MSFDKKTEEENRKYLEELIKRNYINPNIVNAILVLLLSLLVALTVKTTYIFAIIGLIPMTILAMRANMVYSISAVGILGALAYSLGGSGQAGAIVLVYLLPATISGLIFSKSFMYKFSNYSNVGIFSKETGKEVMTFINLKLFFVSIVVYVVGISTYYLFMKYTQGVDLIKEMQVFFDKFLKLYLANIGQEEIDKLNKVGAIDQLKNIASMVPVFVFLRAVILALVTYYVAPLIANLVYEKKILNLPISMIILPGNPVVFMFISILILFSIGWFYKEYNMDIVINNFIIVMNILFFLEGISLFIFSIKKWGSIKKKVNWFLILGLTIVMGVLPGIAVIGMLDNMMNFRERWLSLVGGNNEK